LACIRLLDTNSENTISQIITNHRASSTRSPAARTIDAIGEPKRSPLGLLLLLNLLQGPSHAYRLHKQLQETGKGRVVNLKSRASVYQAIERLEREELVAAVGTSSAAGYPDRVEYALTDRGRAVAIDWLREMLASTGPEFSEFTAALSALFVLAPDDARAQLEARRDRLVGQLKSTEAAITGPEVPAGLPRLFLLDEHYRRDILSAELAWTEALIAELADGRLTWTREWLAEIATSH
jgi:DNA-binding PadR family transcriptional regulator